MDVKLQIVSDVHRDAWPTGSGGGPVIERLAPTLVVLGDVAPIGSTAFVDFFDDVCRVFERVYFVPGNHEYYGDEDKASLQLALHTLIAERWPARLHLLDCTTCDDWAPGYRLLGCTLWSHVHHDHRRAVERCVRDYECIHATTGVPATVADTNAWHAHDVAWLRCALQQCANDGRRAIVLTHYSPLARGTLQPRFEHSRDPRAQSLNDAFCTDLRALLLEFGPHTWAFGHTHWCCTLRVGPTRVVSEPMGYPHENVGQRAGHHGRVLTFDVAEDVQRSVSL